MMRSASASAAPLVEGQALSEIAARYPDALPLVFRARQNFLEGMPIAAAVLTQKDGRYVRVSGNAAFERLDALAMQLPQPAPLIEREPFRSELAAFDHESGTCRQFAWSTAEGAGGRHFVVRVAGLEDMPGYPPRCLLTLLDRTAEVENERSLRAEMLHDSLTGLPNRVAFDEALEAATAEKPGVVVPDQAVLVVDLARFSRVNECMGSVAGDELIITVARRLVSTLRAGDVLARIGGDEFGVLMRAANSCEAREAGERIIAALSAPFRLSDLEIRIDCAVGCAMLRDGGGFVEDVVRNAQFACKRAKTTGAVEIYQPGEASAARRRFSIETELRRAIDGGRLTLAYQPLVNLANGHLTGFEALARWNHDAQGPISPAEFIPVAEECGLIVPLGRWAMDTALEALARWDAALGRPQTLSVAVNLSAIQLVRDDVGRMVSDALTCHGLDGKRLTIELTESAIVQDPAKAAAVLGALKALNCRVAMDDFGTGYSNLAHLQKLPIDVLKIDRSFVTHMLADRDKVAIVRAILGLADALGTRTTAEGIETVELAQTLSALGCSHGQGWYFGQPMDADRAFEMVRQAAEE